MRRFLIGMFILMISPVYAQIYVDSGIQHYHKGEYDEALQDFKSAIEMKKVLTQNAIGKIYFFRGHTWLAIAEKSKGNYPEVNPVVNAFNDLIVVEEYGGDWGDRLREALVRVNSLLLNQADEYQKQAKKAKTLDEVQDWLDRRIEYLKYAHQLEISGNINLYLGKTNKEIGDIIFDNTTNVTKMKEAKKYYEESLRYYELARYDDPFSKDIILDLLTLSERLGDVDRIAEYEKLLELAGG